ncbi:MAG: T9SS type A sorting domain-containing protein [Bacteroidota bacterium]
MIKNYLLLAIFFLSLNTLFCQLRTTNHRIIDNQPRRNIDFGNLKRSATKPTACDVDTSQYPRYKGTAFYTITISSGRSLGQLYSAPKPITVYGFTFHAFVASNPPTAKKMNIICNLYKAGLDSLPSGAPLRSDTILIDSTFAGGQLARIEKHANFKPITMDSAYIITVETDSTSMNAAIVTNSYAAGDGKKENLNCGSISGRWYNGKNLNIGGVPFNADILLYPHVKYAIGADFTIKSQCYNLADTIKFTNLASKTIVGSRMYNYYMLYNLGYYCNWWNTGDALGYTWTVDHKIKYGTKQNYKIELVSSVYTYRSNTFQCSDTTIKWLYYKPDVPQVSGPGNACFGDSARYLILNPDTGALYQWYKKSTDPTPFFIGTKYTKYSLSKSDTFYVRANNNGCYSNYRMVQLNVNAYPKNITYKNDSICSGSKANLKGNADVGNIEWFESPTGGPVIYTGSNFQTAVLTKDTFFYFQANNKGCIITPRTKVSALVGSNFAPSSPTVSRDTIICLGSTALLPISATAGSGLTIRWFNVGSGGSSIATGTTYNFVPTIREVKTLYADAYNGVCGSTREPVQITVEDYPRIAKLMHDTICKGADSAILTLSIPFGDANWYDASSSGNIVTTGMRYALLPSASTTLYVETQSNICKSPNRTAITALVNTYPTVVKLYGDTICAKNKATLKSVLSGPGTMIWYDDVAATTPIGTGITFVTPVLNGSKQFYAQPVYAGCVGPVKAVSPLVKPTPFSGFSYEILSNQRVKVSLINLGDTGIKWYFGDGTTSKSSIVTHKYVNPGIYKVKLVVKAPNGCEDSTIYSLNIIANSINSITALPELKVYPNPSNGKVSVDLGNRGGTISYEIFSIDGQSVMSQMSETDNQKLTVDISHFASGLYILRIAGYQPVMLVRN